jgi:hypothetical protein
MLARVCYTTRLNGDSGCDDSHVVATGDSRCRIDSGIHRAGLQRLRDLIGRRLVAAVERLHSFPSLDGSFLNGRIRSPTRRCSRRRAGRSRAAVGAVERHTSGGT